MAAPKTTHELYEALRKALPSDTASWMERNSRAVHLRLNEAMRTLPRKGASYTMTDVFAGGGLLALAGFIEGYDLQELVECDAAAVKTLSRQLPGRAKQADATQWTPDVPRGGLDVLTGGPPCQGWSTAGKQLGPLDPRNLFPEVIRWAREAQPRVIVMENSPNTVRAGKWKDYWDVWWQTLADEAGYEGTVWVLKAASFGTPQTRERAFYVLWPKGAPWATHLRAGPRPTRLDPRTVQLGSANVYTRAFDRLNDGCCGGFGYSSCVNIGNLDGMCGGCKLGSNYEQADNDVIRDELTPKAIAYLARELTDGRNRLKVQGFIDYGGAFAEWWPTGKRDALVGRWLAPAMTKSMYKGIPYGVTVEPGHTPAGKKGALSPELGEVRQLTPREAAKLQDVPSWYVFAGGQAEEYKQIGNGIPVNMGRAVLAHVRDALQRADGQQPGPPPGSMSAGVDQGLFPLGDLSICSNLGSSGMGGSRTDAPKASLWERYSPQTPTKRSRPTGLPSDLPARAEHLVSAAQGWLGQPEASWAWAVLAGETEDETSTEAMETVLMSMGLDPDRMLDRSIAVHAFKLAMETDPGRWDGSPFGDPIYHHTGGKKQSTGRTRGDAGRSDDHTLPTWLAVAAMADMLTYLAVGEGGKKLRLAPVDRETAKAFLAEHHSQLKQLPRRTMYALGAFRGDRLVAIATAGHPSAPWKRLDQRNVLELTRVASDGTVAGASSMLASAILSAAPVSRRGDPDGPWLFVTYSLASEGGHTYKALKSQGLRPVAVIGGKRGKQGARSSASVTAAKGTAAKVRWEAGPAAGAARWDLLEP